MHRIIFLLCALAALAFPGIAVASQYRGEVTFGGFAVPGATITVTQGANKFTAVSDQGGLYDFADLTDGIWKIEIEMQCFSTIQAEVTITPNMPAAKWELTLLPLDEIMARTKLAPLTAAPPTASVASTTPKKPATPESQNGNAPDFPKPQEDTSQQSSEGLLINGSVNNAATSRFNLDQAFGNRRLNSKSLYTGGLTAIIDNSATDARPYSLSGIDAPKTSYNRITGVFTLGGPIKIPHLMPHGPTFFLAYQWTRDHIAETESGLVPTAAERAGDLSSVPVTIFNPKTDLPFPGNVVPVNPQAQGLLQLYPLPNITGSSLYNYQIPVLNSTHQDALQSRLDYQAGAVDILQDFTADRNKLLSILNTLIVGEGQGSAETVDASSADTGAAFGQDDSEFNVFNTDRQLSALQTAAKMLGQLNEKKSLIYFSGGLRFNGIDNQTQLHATVDAAIKAGVSFWPIDARGLVAEAPLGDATQGSPGNSGLYTGAAALANTNNFQQSQDTLYALAEDTGGKALFDTNDLTRGIVQAQQAISDYYILGYYATNTAQNGRFRRVKISLMQDQNVSLNYRQGYYADKQFSRFTAVDKERQLEDALMLDSPITELSIAMEIDHFQLNRAEYFVPIILKIPGRELALAKRGGAEHTLIDFVGEIKDLVSGDTVTNVRDNVNVKFSDATAAELAHRPIEYDTGFTLLPGKYMIKFLARDDETGRIGTYQTNFVIPNLNKEEKRVPISSVVLSSQRVDLQEALYDAAKAKERAKEAAVNPLVQGGKKLVPSVTRVFSASRDMYIYLQVYKQPSLENPPASKPLVAFVSLYLGGSKVFETPPTAIAPNAASRLGTMPFNFTLGINHLPPGEYDCQVTILDPATLKSTFWRAPILLVP